MFKIIEDPKHSAKTFAFVKNSFQKTRYFGNRFSYAKEKNDGYSSYMMDAYWISRKRNTLNALCYGTITFNFSNNPTYCIDDVDNYQNLTEDNILQYADILKFDDGTGFAKNFSSHCYALFGHGAVWNDSVSDHEYRDLVNNFFNLPHAPENTYGWMTKN